MSISVPGYLHTSTKQSKQQFKLPKTKLYSLYRTKAVNKIVKIAHNTCVSASVRRLRECMRNIM